MRYHITVCNKLQDLILKMDPTASDDPIELQRRLHFEKRRRAQKSVQSQYNKHRFVGDYEVDWLTHAPDYTDFCSDFHVHGRDIAYFFKHTLEGNIYHYYNNLDKTNGDWHSLNAAFAQRCA